jgi:carbamoyltransferase
LGSALALHFNRKIDRKPNVLEHLYYGPEFSNEEIKEKLDRFKLPYRYCEDIEIQTAKLLAGNKIGGWFQGRMEVGARALGARSIIANPADEKSKDRVNGLIKSREGWRPFCPSILEEYFSEYIQFKGRAPFMIITFSFKEDVKNRIPAVVHVDGTARPQTVSKSQNKRFWNLIDEFRKLTGIPLLLNTSFNVREEPIVCDIKDALRTYYSTGLDFLVLGNFLLRKDSKL